MQWIQQYILQQQANIFYNISESTGTKTASSQTEIIEFKWIRMKASILGTKLLWHTLALSYFKFQFQSS